MENPPFDDFPQLETSIYRIFPIFFPYFSQMFPIFFPYFRMNFPLKDPIYLGDFQENFPSAEPSGLARNTLLRTRTTRPWMAQDTPSAELQSFESCLVIRPCYTWWDHKASTVPVRVQVGIEKRTKHSRNLRASSAEDSKLFSCLELLPKTWGHQNPHVHHHVLHWQGHFGYQ